MTSKRKQARYPKSTDVMYEIPLPHPDLEKPKYVIMITYQKPNNITLRARYKTSPRYETMYGALYWLNKQPYNLEYTLLRTDRSEFVRQGTKKIGEIIK